MKKIVFINLQDNDFIFRTFFQVVLKRGAATKHRFYLDYLLDNPEYEVCNHIVANKKHNPFVAYLLRGFKKFEHYFCLKNSKIKKNIRIIDDLSELGEDDLIMYYSHYPSSLTFGQNSCAKKSVCITHFYGLKEDAELIKNLSPDLLWGDGNYPIYSDLYKKNFQWFRGKYIESTFVPEDRFRYNTNFDTRKNMAFATGTVTNCDKKEFVDYYGDRCYQPLRKQILENVDILSSVIESKISNRDETALKQPRYNNVLEKLYCRIYNELTGYKQKKYYSFDMVRMFNNFKLCVVPEDINGIPGVGFVEGMACGCAYVGYEKIDYSQYGLVSGIDYITYDGTVNGLKNVIEYYQARPDELKVIAENGYHKIKKNANKTVTANRLFTSLLS